MHPTHAPSKSKNIHESERISPKSMKISAESLFVLKKQRPQLRAALRNLPANDLGGHMITLAHFRD